MPVSFCTRVWTEPSRSEGRSPRALNLTIRMPDATVVCDPKTFLQKQWCTMGVGFAARFVHCCARGLAGIACREASSMEFGLSP